MQEERLFLIESRYRRNTDTLVSEIRSGFSNSFNSFNEISDSQLHTRRAIGQLEAALGSKISEILSQQQSLSRSFQATATAAGNELVQKLAARGIALFDQQEYVLCASAMTDLLSIDPGSIPGNLYLHAALFRNNPLDSLLYGRINSSLGKVLAAEPANRLALETLAQIAMEEQQWESAYRYLSRLLDFDPENCIYLHKIVTVCYDTRTLQKVEYELSLLMQEFPDNPEYLYYYASLYEHEENMQEAFHLYRKSLNLDSAYRPSLLGASRTGMELGEYEYVDSILAKAHDTDNFTIQSTRAQCRYKLTDLQGSLRLWKDALKLLHINTVGDRKKAGTCCMEIARIYYEEGQISSAQSYVKKGESYAVNNRLAVVKGTNIF